MIDWHYHLTIGKKHVPHTTLLLLFYDSLPDNETKWIILAIQWSQWYLLLLQNTILSVLIRAKLSCSYQKKIQGSQSQQETSIPQMIHHPRESHCVELSGVHDNTDGETADQHKKMLLLLRLRGLENCGHIPNRCYEWSNRRNWIWGDSTTENQRQNSSEPCGTIGLWRAVRDSSSSHVSTSPSSIDSKKYNLVIFSIRSRRSFFTKHQWSAPCDFMHLKQQIMYSHGQERIMFHIMQTINASLVSNNCAPLWMTA